MKEITILNQLLTTIRKVQLINKENNKNKDKNNKKNKEIKF